MTSSQILTTTLLRQYATSCPGDRIQVSTKLGTVTLVRADFPQANFPTDEVLQAAFLRDLMEQANPCALSVLKGSAGQCLEDQARAVRQVIHAVPVISTQSDRQTSTDSGDL